jgi:hypothetical protein
MTTSSSASGTGSTAPPLVRAVDNTAVQAPSAKKVNARPAPGERGAASARSGMSDRPTGPTPAKEAAKKATGPRAAPSGASATRPQSHTTIPLKSPNKPLQKRSQPSRAPQVAAAPQPQSKPTPTPSTPAARPQTSTTPRPVAGDREIASKKTVQPTKNPEKDVVPKKRPEENKEHPYTKGRVSTMKAIRHVAVNLATGFVGGYLLNSKLDKAGRMDVATPPRQEANRQESARRAEMRTDLSPRQQQQVRIRRATTPAPAVPVTTAAKNLQSSARRAADAQTQPIGRPEQQARIKREPLQAAPVKAKGRGR